VIQGHVHPLHASAAFPLSSLPGGCGLLTQCLKGKRCKQHIWLQVERHAACSERQLVSKFGNLFPYLFVRRLGESRVWSLSKSSTNVSSVGVKFHGIFLERWNCLPRRGDRHWFPLCFIRQVGSVEGFVVYDSSLLSRLVDPEMSDAE
jgi:hypothetical protein